MNFTNSTNEIILHWTNETILHYAIPLHLCFAWGSRNIISELYCTTISKYLFRWNCKSA